MDRRKFIDHSIKTASFLALSSVYACQPKKHEKPLYEKGEENLLFKISLAEWSFHRSIRSGKMDHLDFAHEAGKLGIRGVEYVSTFFQDKAKDLNYLKEMDMRATGEFVSSLLIMVDEEGDLAYADDAVINQSVENHKKWIEAASHLKCHSIRVNLFGKGSRQDCQSASVQSLSKLADYAKPFDINILVENHGGYSSDGQWLSETIRKVAMDNCGTLPDFGNFCIRREGGGLWSGDCIEEYDRYRGVEELMPFAKAVSAKSYDFDEYGNTSVDFSRMLDIIVESGYSDYIGIEYEGNDEDEKLGILRTKALLDHYLNNKVKEL
jgi:sugar phosphate isomerase/epimerase